MRGEAVKSEQLKKIYIYFPVDFVSLDQKVCIVCLGLPRRCRAINQERQLSFLLAFELAAHERRKDSEMKLYTLGLSIQTERKRLWRRGQGMLWSPDGQKSIFRAQAVQTLWQRWNQAAACKWDLPAFVQEVKCEGLIIEGQWINKRVLCLSWWIDAWLESPVADLHQLGALPSQPIRCGGSHPAGHRPHRCDLETTAGSVVCSCVFVCCFGSVWSLRGKFWGSFANSKESPSSSVLLFFCLSSKVCFPCDKPGLFPVKFSFQTSDSVHL